MPAPSTASSNGSRGRSDSDRSLGISPRDHLAPLDPSRSPSLSGRFVEDFTYLEAKLPSSPIKLLLTKIVFVIASIIFGIFLIPTRLYSYYKMKPLLDGIEKAYAEKLLEATNVSLQGKYSQKTMQEWVQNRAFLTDTQAAYLSIKKGKKLTQDQINAFYRQADDFSTRVLDIYKMVRSRKSYKDIRVKIDLAMKNPVYQALKTKEIPSVEFLQVLAVKYSSVNSKDLLKEYGKQNLGEISDKQYQWFELASLLDKEVDGFAHKRNRLYQNVMWGMTFPDKAMHSAESVFTPLDYNAYENNPDLYAHDFVSEDGKRSLQFSYGPGPTGDNLYKEGVLPYLDKLNEKGVSVHHLRINLQSHKKDGRGTTKAEHVRVCQMLEYGQEHPDSLTMMSLAFDTKARDMGTDFILNTRASDDLINEVTKNLKAHYLAPLEQGDAWGLAEEDKFAYRTLKHDGTDNGWYIPNKVLEHEEIEKAFDVSQAIFNEIERHANNHIRDKSLKDRQRFGRVMLLTVEGMVSLAALHKTLEKVPNKEDLDQSLDEDLTASRIFAHCKQDIDRGIVNNVTLRLFHRILTDISPLSKDEVYEIAGGVLGRARIVDRRNIIWKRYENLSDFLHYFDSTEKVRALSEHLKKYIKQL